MAMAASRFYSHTYPMPRMSQRRHHALQFDGSRARRHLDGGNVDRETSALCAIRGGMPRSHLSNTRSGARQEEPARSCMMDSSLRSKRYYKRRDNTRQNSSFQENVPNDAAEPAASRRCLFPSPFLRESGGDDSSLHDARNFDAWF
jgi:hypothetical protein